MTRVCLVGEEGQHLSYELLSRETAREALAAYDLREPFHNTVAVETISLGAAVALLNDLEWYLVRFVDEAMVLEPSVSEGEWLSRELATAIRDSEVDAAESGRLLKVYGLEYPDDDGDGPNDDGDGPDDDRDGPNEDPEAPDEDPEAPDEDPEASGASPGEDGIERGPAPTAHGGDEAAGKPRLVEPMFVARTGERLPEYDLRAVDETLVVRVTEAEFEAEP